MDRGLIRRATKGYLPDSIRLNQLTRGHQGADVFQRMKKVLPHLIDELNELIHDPIAQTYLNIELIKNGLETLKQEQIPSKYAMNPEFRIVMRSLIVYRFLKHLKGGEKDEKRMANTSIRST
jgi:asparagine synthase (glutamine-hydrolysing)